MERERDIHTHTHTPRPPAALGGARPPRAGGQVRPSKPAEFQHISKRRKRNENRIPSVRATEQG